MSKYWRLFVLIFKNNFARETEFRANLFLWMFTDLCWVGMQVVLISIYFSFTPSISGWSFFQFLALVGLFRIIKGFFDTFFRLNLTRLPEYVALGDLDYSLTRPVNSLFFISSRYHILSELFSVIAGIGIFGYAIIVGHLQFSFFSLLLALPMAICGLIVLYSLVLAFTCLAFFVTRLTAMSSYYDVVSQTLRMPTDVYSANNNRLLILLLPFVAAVTLPAKILLSLAPWPYLFLELFLSVTIFYLVYRFWLYSLSHYSSASS